MLANVGIKIYIALKSAVSAVLKGVFKNLIKPYIKSYIDQKEVLRGGDITSLLCCSDFILSLYILFRVKVKLLENVGIKSYIGKNVGKCECGNLYKITTKYYIEKLYSKNYWKIRE